MNQNPLQHPFDSEAWAKGIRESMTEQDFLDAEARLEKLRNSALYSEFDASTLPEASEEEVTNLGIGESGDTIPDIPIDEEGAEELKIEKPKLDDFTQIHATVHMQKVGLGAELKKLTKKKASVRTGEEKKQIMRLEVGYNVLNWVETEMMNIKLRHKLLNELSHEASEVDPGLPQEPNTVYTEAGDGTVEDTGLNLPNEQ